MAGQEQVNRTSREEDDGATPVPVPVPAGGAADMAVDSLLDEIDDLLEINAESFVRGFVQKGGQ